MSALSPSGQVKKSIKARAAIRSSEWTGHTSGMAEGHVQGNVVILPELLANDFFDGKLQPRVYL